MAAEGLSLQEKLVCLQKKLDRTELVKRVIALLGERFQEAGLSCGEPWVTSGWAHFKASVAYSVEESKFVLDLNVQAGCYSTWEEVRETVDQRFTLVVDEVLSEFSPQCRVVDNGEYGEDHKYYNQAALVVEGLRAGTR